MENSKIIQILDRRFKISVSKILDFYTYDDETCGLVYLDDGETIDENKCPKITESIYKDVFIAVENGILEIMAESRENEISLKNIDMTDSVANGLSDAGVEGYESLEDYNIVIEEIQKNTEFKDYESLEDKDYEANEGFKICNHCQDEVDEMDGKYIKGKWYCNDCVDNTLEEL